LQFYSFFVFFQIIFSMDSDPLPTFPGYVSIPTLAHSLHGSEIFFSSKEELDSVLLSLTAIPDHQYRGSPGHFNFLLAGNFQKFFTSSSDEEPQLQPTTLDISGVSRDSVSSTATTVQTFESLDSANPNWELNVRKAAKDLTLPYIASSNFLWDRFNDLLSSRLLSTQFKLSSKDTSTALESIFQSCFQLSPPSAESPVSKNSSASDSSNSDDDWIPAEHVMNPRIGADRNYIRSQLKSPSLSASTRARMESFLSTPKTSHVDDLTTLTSSNSAASSILQLLSPIEQDRPKLKDFTPVDLHSFLAKYEDYHRYKGTFSLALCLTVRQLKRLYHPDAPPEVPTDEDVRTRLTRLIPARNHAQLREYFNSKVAMRFPKELKNGDQYDLSKYDDSDLWNYYARFLQFLDDSKLYWAAMDAKSAFIKQRSLFISGSKPQSFTAMLEDRKHDMDSTEDIRLAVLDASTFAQNLRLTSHRPQKYKKKGSTTSSQSETSHPSSAGYYKNPNQPPGQHQSAISSATVHKKVKKLSNSKFADDEVTVFDPGVLDSGSSVHTVPSTKYLTSVTPIDRADGPLLAANDTQISVLGQGDCFLSPNIPLANVLVTPDIPQPIVSPQLLLGNTNSSILLSSSNAYLVRDSVANNVSVSNLINNSMCIATLDPSDNLYKTHPLSNSPSPFTINTVRRYATVSFKTLAEEVAFWHSALGHQDVEVMVQTFNTSIFKKSHPHLTSTIIRKHFPTSCPDCPIGNLQMRHPPVDPVTHHGPGEAFEVDIQGKWTDSAGKPAKSFSGDIYAFAAIDCATDLVFARTIQTRVSLVDHLEALRVSALSTGKVLKVIRTDNEYITLLSKAWALSHNISFQPSIPFEHNTVRRVERVHRTLQEMVVKALAHKPHLSPEYWSMCYMHCVDLHNVLPNRDSGISPFERYHGFAPDLGFSPILPFGSIVMAHLPLQLQTTLSGRAVETVYVGRAPLHRDAILVFNPLT
jgi:hypothetical protein